MGTALKVTGFENESYILPNTRMYNMSLSLSLYIYSKVTRWNME